MEKLALYLGSASYCLGDPTDIKFSHEKIVQSFSRQLSTLGHTKFCAANESIAAMCERSLDRTLDKWGNDVHSIGAVVIGSGVEFLKDADEDTERMLGARMPLKYVKCPEVKDCAVFHACLEAAADLMFINAVDTALLVTYGYIPAGMSRLDKDGTKMFGDGAATCILSTKCGDFEHLATSIGDDEFLRAAEASEGVHPRNFLRRCNALTTTIAQCYAEAGVGPTEIASAYVTNGNSMYHQIIAECAGINVRRVSAAGLKKYGHVFSCDNIVSLADETSMLTPGDIVLLVGWSSYRIGASLLKVCK